MVSVLDLWLPILVGTVLVFVASSVIHMMIPWHKNDKKQLPQEDAVMDALRASGAPPDDYYFPYCASMADMNSEEYVAKREKGPCGFLTLTPPGPMNMGKALGQWFAFLLIALVFVAYVTGRALGPGADYLHVFQIAGATGFMALGLGAPIESIWSGQKWTTSFKFLIDGLVYALVAAGVFGWLWPSVA